MEQTTDTFIQQKLLNIIYIEEDLPPKTTVQTQAAHLSRWI